jgi:hypothetical protein
MGISSPFHELYQALTVGRISRHRFIEGATAPGSGAAVGADHVPGPVPRWLGHGARPQIACCGRVRTATGITGSERWRRRRRPAERQGDRGTRATAVARRTRFASPT